MTKATDIDALKSRLKATWMDGNYDHFSRYMESSAIQFLDRVEIKPGAQLLDVACGSGQLALVAARRGAKVTGIDIAANSIEAARGRAAAEGLEARFDEGDAEALPYGPTTRAFAALGEPEQAALRTELVDHWSSHKRTAEANRTAVDAKYLEVVGTRA